MMFLIGILSACELHRKLALLFSASEALEDAKKREKELEAEVRRVTQQLKEVMDKVVEHTEEEINQLRELSDERQETLLVEARAREENAKYVLKYFLLKYLSFPHFFILFFDLAEYCWRRRLAWHKKMRR